MWQTLAGYHIGFAALGVVSILSSARGGTPWLAGCGFGATLVWSLFLLGAIHSAGRRARREGVVVQLDDDRLCVKTDKGEWASGWARGWRLHRFDDYWLLVSPMRSVVPLPVEVMPADVRSFIEQRVVASGGSIG
jgi:hypothetical protein